MAASLQDRIPRRQPLPPRRSLTFSLRRRRRTTNNANPEANEGALFPRSLVGAQRFKNVVAAPAGPACERETLTRKEVFVSATRKAANKLARKETVRPHQPGQSTFTAILPEEIDWKPINMVLLVLRPADGGRSQNQSSRLSFTNTFR